jgi:hypothetical protein
MNQLVDKALQAQQTAENLKQEAITSLLGEQRTIADQLKALGYVEGQKMPPKKAVTLDPNKVCPVCKEKGHDARRHKNDPKPAPSKPAVTAAK